MGFFTSLLGGGDRGGVGGADRGSWIVESMPAILSYFNGEESWLQHTTSSPSVADFLIGGLHGC